MLSLYANSNDILYGIKKYVADTEADITSLPTNIKPGSMVFVIGSGNCYMLGSSGTWTKTDIGLNWIDFYN